MGTVFAERVYPALSEQEEESAPPTKWGTWRARLYADFLPGKVPRIRLQRYLRFTDADGRDHYVPAAFITDGATIPKWCWWFVGGPLTEQYLRAATLHDFQIGQKTETWQVVHSRLYRALRADQVGAVTATLFRVAVLVRGPRW